MKGAKASSNLQRVYSTLTREEVRTLVTEPYSRCKAGDSLLQLPKFLWQRIFTFNIDDALEDAYSQIASPQDASPINFNEPFEDLDDLHTLNIVHLHGYTRKSDSGYVFSRTEYARQMRDLNPWMHVLSQLLPTQPFIIAGTSLDESDLEYYLAGRDSITSRADRGPSLIIEPFPDSVTRADCKRYDLTLVEATTKDFFEYLDHAVPGRPMPISMFPPETRNLFPPKTSGRTVVSFLTDFGIVPRETHPPETPPRFLYGHLPSWDDLGADIDIPRTGTNELTSTVQDMLSDKKAERILVLSDEPGAGKSTVLRRVALDLTKQGVQVLTCTPLSRLEAEPTAAALDLIDDPIVIVVDNLADQVRAIAEISLRLEKRDVVFLAAEREYRWRYCLRVMSGTPALKSFGLGLTTTQAEQLIRLYTSYGMIGSREAVLSPERLAFSLANNPIAVSACLIMGDFKPIESLIESLWNASDPLSRERYLSAALAQFCFRGGVRYEVLASATSRRGWEEQFGAQHPLSLDYFGGTGRSFIVPLNATIATQVLELVSKREPEHLVKVFVGLANSLASRVNRRAIRRRSPEARLAGRLFDFDGVVEHWLGDSAATFYAETQDAWQWNSRYWEQVALLQLSRFHAIPQSERGQEALRQAIQHARHAVSIEPHPFTLTTLGKCLLAQVGQVGYSSASIYEEAFNRLAQAIEIEKNLSRVSIQPFITLFRGSISYTRLRNTLTEAQLGELRDFARRAGQVFRKDSELGGVIDELYDVVL